MILEKIEPGIYIVAVSGGVDSVVLLDLLRKNKELKLVVAHLDHGIRGDSHQDLELVRKLSLNLGLKFESKSIKLGPIASEALARDERYKFLNQVKSKHKAKAIITAHHQDDAIETAIINMLRGTKSRGLSALKSTSEVIRPLIKTSKLQINNYAKVNKLLWRDDPTNDDAKYLRNYVRKNIINDLSPTKRQKLLSSIDFAAKTNKKIDQLLSDITKDHTMSSGSHREIDRSWYILLPSEIRLEVLKKQITSLQQAADLDTKQLTYLDLLARTAANGVEHRISNKLVMAIVPLKVLVMTKTL